MNKNLSLWILKALLACDGLPMPQGALIAAVENLSRPEKPTKSDIEAALKKVETGGYAAGVSDDIEETTWTLTDKGTHKARQL
jgi:hypothetical protein